MSKEKKLEILNYNELPKKEGVGALKGKEVIDWKSIKEGFIFKTQHKDYGYNEFEFVEYNIKTGYLKLKYNNKDVSSTTSNFVKGQIGKITNKRSSNFKKNIGDLINDNNRDLIIIDREYRYKINPNAYDVEEKYYKYRCNRCSNEDWIIESSLVTSGTGCNVCASKKSALGINTIYDTDPWMMDLGVSEEDAKGCVRSSNKSIKVTCPNCGSIKKISPYVIYRTKSIGCKCGDGTSYSEKFVNCILSQLNVKFITQLSKSNFLWCKNYKYDFYIPKHNIVIETHGEQHYKKANGFRRTLEEEQENDKIKKELALSNKIEYYIIIDCRKSELEWIKNNILNSELNKLFDLSNINWLKCEEFALKNIVKEVCEYWNNKNDEESTTDLGKIFGYDRTTIRNYLKKGTKLGWTSYDSEVEAKKTNKNNTKQVLVYKDNILLSEKSYSVRELSRLSVELFGVKLHSGGISEVCNGIRKHYKGFIFKYI